MTSLKRAAPQRNERAAVIAGPSASGQGKCLDYRVFRTAERGIGFGSELRSLLGHRLTNKAEHGQARML